MTRAGLSSAVVVGLVLSVQVPRIAAQGIVGRGNTTIRNVPGIPSGTIPGSTITPFGGPNVITQFNPYVAAGVAASGLNPYYPNPYYANAFVPPNAGNVAGMSMPPPYPYYGYPAAPGVGLNGPGAMPETGVMGRARSDAGVSAVLNGQGLSGQGMSRATTTKPTRPVRARTRKSPRR